MVLYLYILASISKSDLCLYSHFYDGLSTTDSCIVNETLTQKCYTEMIMYSNIQLIHGTTKIAY